MAAVAHGWHMPGGGGPPKKVAVEFNEADSGKKVRKPKPDGRMEKLRSKR
jgi:hypothetical protein